MRLEQMLPLTLGANIGTTMTALMAAMVTSGTDPLQVALAHLMFNITGIIIWYPIPFMRNVPLHAARQLGKATRVWRGFPIVYILVMFFLIPLLFLGISNLFTQDSKGLTVLGSFLVVILFLVICWGAYTWHYKGGKDKCYDCLLNRQQRSVALKTLPEDMEFLKAKIQALSEHTGLPEDEEEPEVEAPAEVEDKAEEAEATQEEEA